MSFNPPRDVFDKLTGLKLAAYDSLCVRNVASMAEISKDCEGRAVEDAVQWLRDNGFAEEIVGGRFRFVKIDGSAPKSLLPPPAKKPEPKKSEAQPAEADFFQAPKPAPVAEKPKATTSKAVADETKLSLDLF